MKKLLAIVSIVMLTAISMNVSADNTESEDTRPDFKAMKVEAKEKIDLNKDEIKENITEFRDENSEEYKAIVAELSDEEKAELAELKETFKVESEALKEETINAETQEDKEAIREEMKELYAAHAEELNELLGEDAAALMEKRKELHDENKELRTENKRTREEFKVERKEYISTYKTAFVERIGNRLDNIPTANLETALEKINAKIDKVEANENMSDTAKETLLDALLALLEIVEDRIADEEGE